MLNLTYSSIRVSRNRPVISSVTTLEEGTGLIASRVNGELQVGPSVGAANTEEFAGFALNERTAPALFPSVLLSQVVVLVTGTTYGVSLPRPVVGAVRVAYTTSGTALTLSGSGGTAAPNAGEYRITSGNIVEVNVADLAKKINITFKYSPTIQDILTLGGDNSPTTFLSIVQFTGNTGVIEEGVIFTSFFDVAIDWANWTPTVGLKLAANGVITSAAGTGATITRGRVVAAPTTDIPFLGVDFAIV